MKTTSKDVWMRLMREVMHVRRLGFEEARRIVKEEFPEIGEPPEATALANEGLVLMEGEAMPFEI